MTEQPNSHLRASTQPSIGAVLQACRSLPLHSSTIVDALEFIDWYSKLPEAVLTDMGHVSRRTLCNFFCLTSDCLRGQPRFLAAAGIDGTKLSLPIEMDDAIPSPFLGDPSERMEQLFTITRGLALLDALAPLLHTCLPEHFQNYYADRMEKLASRTQVTQEIPKGIAKPRPYQHTVRMYSAFGRRVLARDFYRAQKNLAIRKKMGELDFTVACISEMEARIARVSKDLPSDTGYLTKFACSEYRLDVTSGHASRLGQLIVELDQIAFWHWRAGYSKANHAATQWALEPLKWITVDNNTKAVYTTSPILTRTPFIQQETEALSPQVGNGRPARFA
ncbi:MAG: hypothetical protein EPN77_19425 [Candidimonas sp.]|nr:MAG: hypothetical protein EPN77_19425 [Candidimonas sp.]